MRLLLIRHGETTANCEGRFQGQKDYYLTSNGEEQARKLGESLQGTSLDAIYTSPLTRAKDTASKIADYQDVSASEHSLINEYDWGVIEGHTRVEIKDKYPDLGMKLDEDFFATSIPGEEGLMNLKTRVTDFYDYLVSEYGLESDSTIAVVTHGRFLGGLVVFLTGYSFFNTPWPFAFANASITELSYWREHNKAKIIRLNDTCHL